MDKRKKMIWSNETLTVLGEKYKQQLKSSTCLEQKKDTQQNQNTHESSAGVAEGGLLVRHLMEVVQVVEVEAQLSTYWHPSHEIGCDLLSANLSFPAERAKEQSQQISKALNLWVLSCLELNLAFYLIIQCWFTDTGPKW